MNATQVPEFFSEGLYKDQALCIRLDFSNCRYYRAVLSGMLYDFEIVYFNLVDDGHEMIVGVKFDNLADWKHFCIKCREDYKLGILDYEI